MGDLRWDGVSCSEKWDILFCVECILGLALYETLCLYQLRSDSEIGIGIAIENYYIFK